jgi:hypothetical protein
MAGKTSPGPDGSEGTFQSSWNQFLEVLGLRSGEEPGEGEAAGAVALSPGKSAPGQALTFAPYASASKLKVRDRMEPGDAKGIQTGFSAGKKAADAGSKAPAQAHEVRKRDGLNKASVPKGIEPASGWGFGLGPVFTPEIAASRAASPPGRRGDTGDTFATESRGAHLGGTRLGGLSTSAVGGEAKVKGVGPADDIAGISSADANGGGIPNGKASAASFEEEHKPGSIEAAGNPGSVEPGQYLNDALQARQPAPAAVKDAAIANAATATSTDSRFDFRLAGNAAPSLEHRSALKSGRAVEPLLGHGSGKPARAMTGGESAGERGFSNIAAQDAGNPMLVREPAVGADVRGRQEGWAGPAGGAGNEMKGGTGEDTFARLDAAGTSRSIHWVQAGAHRAEAGYLDPALGWVAVRAESSVGGVHAAVLPGSPEAAQVLGTHLIGLNAFLAQEHGPHATATMAAPEDRRSGAGAQQGNSAGGGSGRDEGAQRSNAVPEGREGDPSPQAAASAAGAVNTSIGSGGSAIRRAGTYVSVMA